MKRVMKSKKARIAILAFGLIVVTSAVAIANDAFVMTATGTVRAALVITEHQPLDFGGDGVDLYQGVSKSVPLDGPGTGSFIITGAAADNIQAQILLPEYLWCATAGVKQRVDLFFDDTDAAWDNTEEPDPELAVGPTVVDPRALPTLTIAGGATTVNVFLGGTAIPSAFQKAGTYTADIVLTAWYEGG